MDVRNTEGLNTKGLCSLGNWTIGNIMGYPSKVYFGAVGITLTVVSKEITYSQEKELLRVLSENGISQKYHIKRFGVKDNKAEIVFDDTYQDINNLETFIGWFYPQLESIGIEKARICAYCGEILEEQEKVIFDGEGYDAHPECAAKLEAALKREKIKEIEEKEKLLRYFTGTLGALLGALIGALIAAIVYKSGKISAFTGVAITFLSERGYWLMKGRKGGIKLLILMLCVILATVAGVFLGINWSIIDDMKESGVTEVDYGKIIGDLIETIKTTPEMMGALLKDILMSLLFSGLGFLCMLRWIIKKEEAEDARERQAIK